MGYSASPEAIAITRRRAYPHRASTPPQHGPHGFPAASRASTLSAGPRTDCSVVPPPAPSCDPHPESSLKIAGKAAAITDTAHGDAVRHAPAPPHHIKSTPSNDRDTPTLLPPSVAGSKGTEPSREAGSGATMARSRPRLRTFGVIPLGKITRQREHVRFLLIPDR